MRNRAGIIQRFLTGTDEVEYSNVTKTESKDGMWFGTRAGTGRGIFQHPSREASGIKSDSNRAKIIINDIHPDGYIRDFSGQRGP
jgi:hypothetical protein